MRKLCDAHSLSCAHNKPVKMLVAVNFGGEVRTYCSSKCASDDIREASEGSDSFEQADAEGDVFFRIDNQAAK